MEHLYSHVASLGVAPSLSKSKPTLEQICHQFEQSFSSYPPATAVPRPQLLPLTASESTQDLGMADMYYVYIALVRSAVLVHSL